MMDKKNASYWRPHVFDEGNLEAERGIRLALVPTLLVMAVEVGAGIAFNSMALLADGLHMVSHLIALTLALFSYKSSRYFSNSHRFAFGTWKIEVLGGYTSAVILVGVAAIMLYESFKRLVLPLPINYDLVIFVALVGFATNILCVHFLRDESSFVHDHVCEDISYDPNQQSAYMHIVADAATSILAIIALFCGKFYGAYWLDPIMGIVGSILIFIWAYNLIKESCPVLLDAEMDSPVTKEIVDLILFNYPDVQITDLHVWRVAKTKYSCIVSLLMENNISVEEVHHSLRSLKELTHITVELVPKTHRNI